MNKSDIITIIAHLGGALLGFGAAMWVLGSRMRREIEASKAASAKLTDRRWEALLTAEVSSRRLYHPTVTSALTSVIAFGENYVKLGEANLRDVADLVSSARSLAMHKAATEEAEDSAVAVVAVSTPWVWTKGGDA